MARFLGTAQLGGRDHFHGLGDLPRVDYAANAPFDVENVGHELGRLQIVDFRSSAQIPALSLTRQGRGTRELRDVENDTDLHLATNCCFASLMTVSISAFRASSMVFFSMMVRRRAGLTVSHVFV